jgi:hypothetical protein
MSDECMELQNIKYQTMLLNGNSKVVSTKKDTGDISDFLNKEKALNKDKPWSKLGKHLKIKLLFAYVESFCADNKCNSNEKQDLKKYLARCLERKKLTRVKDVSYDAKNGVIKKIPGLTFDKARRRFTLRKIDKKNSTLKGLAPTRSKKNKSKHKLKKKNLKDKNKSRPKKDKIDIKK